MASDLKQYDLLDSWRESNPDEKLHVLKGPKKQLD